MERKHPSMCLFLVAVIMLYAGIAGAEPASDIKAWPLFYYASDPVTSETRTEFLWPLYVRQGTPEYTANQILSFPQRYPTQYPHQFYLGWPLSGLRTGRGHDAWIFPFLWSNNDHFTLFPVFWYGDDYCSLFPAFYFGSRSSKKTLNIALLQHNVWGEHERMHSLWPLLWYSTDLYDTSYSKSFGALPLYWQREYTYTNKNNRSASQSGGVLLLNWWHRSQHESIANTCSYSTNSSDGVFPVFYRSQSDNNTVSESETRMNHYDSMWIALYRESHKTNKVTRRNVISEVSADSHHTLFPLWWDWREERYGVIDSGRTLFPLWWRSTKIKADVLAESTTFLVPIGAHLYKKGQYETQNLFGPLFNRTEHAFEDYVRYDAFFPVFSRTTGRRISGGRVFPLAGWESKRSRYSNLWYLFPLGWDCETQVKGEYRVDKPRFFALHEMESKPFVNYADCRSTGARSTAAFYPFFWSKREADQQSTGYLPFWCSQTYRSGANISTETLTPLLLSHKQNSELNGRTVFTRRDYLLSMLAWGNGEDYKLRRILPLFSYQDSYGHSDLSMLVPPFSYKSWQDHDKPELHYSSELSVPFSFLPLFRSKASCNGINSETRTSWLFPFYKRSVERSEERNVEKLSVLWPLWNGEWENDETRIRGLGGMCNYYEKDSNKFVEQRILYRLFSRRTRSWFSEHELMPFYSRQTREDGDSYWKILGGLLGSETRGDRSYFSFLFIPIPAGKVARPDDGTLAARQKTHADLALNYLKHNRHDRAAIEFTLAGDARADDRDFQLAAGTAYLDADPDAVGKELRASIPSALESLGGKGGYCDVQGVLKNLRQLSIRYFETAIRLGADKSDTLRDIAAAYRDMGQLETALQKLNESDELRPGFSVGMERLNLLGMLGWVGWDISGHGASRHQPKPDKPRILEFRRQWFALLKELRNRYPESPSLVRLEAEAPEDNDSDAPAYRYSGYGYNISQDKIFSADTLRRLALYELGSGMKAGPEELAWIAAGQTGGRRLRFAGNLKSIISLFPETPRNEKPGRTCAVRAIGILNQQIYYLMNDKKYAEIEPILPRIRNLLPRACETCDGVEAARAPHYRYNEPVDTAMGHLYRLHVDTRKDPLAYIAAAKDWAAMLCPHQRKAIERSLESVRFEQQYLKQWRITPVAGKVESKTYSGEFFKRYVNLDSILGHPDRCTVTAECVIVSPDERQVVLRLGFDHRLKAELNGQTIFEEKARRIAVRDEFSVSVKLLKGDNKLTLTVADDKLAYGFFARLSDVNGKHMEDVTIRE